MFRRSKRGIALLALMALLLTMLPIGTVFAASNTEVLSRPVVDDDGIAELGSVFMQVVAGKIRSGDTATIRLPDGFKFLDSGTDEDEVMTSSDWVAGLGGSGAVVGNVYNYFEFPDTYQSEGNGLRPNATLTVTQLDDNEISIETGGIVDTGEDCYLYLHLGSVYVDSGFEGDITLTIDAPSDSGITPGSVTIGRVTGGAVDLEVTNVPTFTNDAAEDDYLKFRIKEDTPGALADEDESVKLVLPNGFEFVGEATVSVLWGEATNGTLTGAALATYIEGLIEEDADELYLDLPAGFESNKAINMEVTVNYTVEDETDAETGEVKARVTGESDTNVSELVVGQYGQYDVTIEAGEAPTVIAGMLEQTVAEVTVKESVKDSLTDGRTLILTLPSNAKWGAVDTDTDSSVSLDFVGFPGKDGKAAKWEVDTTAGSSDAAELVLDDLEVVLEPGFEGDLIAEVSGTAGLSGELVLAKEVKSVTIEASSKPVVGIGQGSQELGDFTITEIEAGAIADGQDLLLDLPEGVSWSGVPTVEVTEGDLEIDEDGITTKADNSDDNQLVIPIDDKSAVASTIKVSGVKVNINRSVPESDIWVKAKGDAVAEVNNETEVKDYYGNSVDGYLQINSIDAFEVDSDYKVFPETGTAAKATIATVGTPGEASAEVKFVIGSTTYNVNGVEQTMDVAPYLKDGRTYLPVRYVAQALGVTDSNILWDEASQKVTLIKGDKVLQVTIGSNIMLVNGVAITMDVPAEITSDRTMLPFRFIAQAFGADVQWDDATQTVTMTN